MSYSAYTYIAALNQGEVSFTIEKEKVTDSCLYFDLKAFSDKFQNVDIAFEYRLNDSKTWKTDSKIIASKSKYIQNNKLLGLSASKQGTSNKFQWKYIDNDILSGMELQVRLRLLPRVKSFSNFGSTTVISEGYDNSFFDLEGSINKKCIGKDLYGRYICLGANSVEIYTNLEDASPIYIKSGLSSPLFAKQIRNGRYIVCDSNNIIEFDETLSTTKSFSISDTVYFDYSEYGNTLLIVSNGSSTIREITWGDDYGSLIWTSPSIFVSPSCATYNRNNFDEIVAVDDGFIVLFNRQDNSYSMLDKYKLKNATKEEGTKDFWRPYRAYFYDDNTICVIEKDGEEINFASLFSSSSSSIDSSSSSSSSSGFEMYDIMWNTITGSPDGTGTYIVNGTYNSKPSYQREDGAYWLYSSALYSWLISANKEDVTPLWAYNSLLSTSTPPIGIYLQVLASTSVKVLFANNSSSSSSSSSS